MLAISEYGFELSKQKFWHSICLRYGWEISILPPTRPCGSKFDIEHRMSCCNYWGFVTIRHNNSRDLTAKEILEVCYDSEIEPAIVLLSGEDISNQTTIRFNEARRDVRAHGFWERGQQAFFYLRLFDPNAYRYLNKSLQHCHVINENEKERAYNERVLQIDHGTLTPLVLSLTEVSVEIATGFTADYEIYYQRNLTYQSQQSQTG